MKVFKFGGASVKDAAGIENLGKIVKGESDQLLIVVSAFGKTTNSLEGVLKAWKNGSADYSALLDEVHEAHLSVITDLFGEGSETQNKTDIS